MSKTNITIVSKKTIDFSDIFNEADSLFGIDWNSCNDIFFNGILDYGKTTVLYSGQCASYSNSAKGVVSEEEIKLFRELPTDDLAEKIIQKIKPEWQSLDENKFKDIYAGICLDIILYKNGVEGEIYVDCD